MKRVIPVVILVALTTLFGASGAHADGRGWGHRHHGHHHHDSHHHGRHHGYVSRVMHARPVHIHEHYYERPRVVRHYHRAPVVYQERYPVHRHHRTSGTLPIIAGGVLGGVLGDQFGGGNHGAIIGGSVLGSVVGHEMSR